MEPNYPKRRHSSHLHPVGGGVSAKTLDTNSLAGTATVSTLSTDTVPPGYTAIYTAEDLKNINNNLSGNYILMNDIDLSGINWDPIGEYDAASGAGHGFTGVLDGNGYAIKNLTINNQNKDAVSLGLFAYVGAGSTASDPDTAPRTEIKNLGFENVNLTSCTLDQQNSAMGVLSGATGNYVDISNCYASGKIDTSTAYVGGLVGVSAGDYQGNNSYSSITGCYSSVDIENGFNDINAMNGAGGIVGYMIHTYILNSYFDGSVSCGNYAGGIAGGVYSGATMNCFVTGSVSGINSGGIAGMFAGGDMNSIWNVDTTGQTTASSDDSLAQLNNTQGLTTAEMQNPANWQGWDDTVWDFSTYPPKLKWQTQSSSNPGGDTDADDPNTPGGGDVPIPGAVRLQIGSDSSSTSAIYVDTSFDLGAFDVDFSSADSCAAAIEDIDEVLSRINTKRSEFGAVINRLSSILESQTTMIQNFTSAKSTIMDADIANESADFVKNQILQQTSSALLAQSQNLHASIVLSLIG